MVLDNFLDKRKNFAKELGFPNLYEFIDQFSLFAGINTIGNKLWTYELIKKTVIFLSCASFSAPPLFPEKQGNKPNPTAERDKRFAVRFELYIN